MSLESWGNHNNQVFSLKFEPDEHKEITPNATPFQVCLPDQERGVGGKGLGRVSYRCTVMIAVFYLTPVYTH